MDQWPQDLKLRLPEYLRRPVDLTMGISLEFVPFVI